ncbi:MAG: hypothetical protein KIT02_13495 [Devosia sp.]|uniref:MGH1-like glycoside hydrolase domain-containing protein n=1 Tax=Devosia sp. TaxID=1871048 RepID=UPI0024CA470C|nr:hypothetical protein [Devosia sp.]UYN98937.1 MAG: hypothetical protein KIT02_13495 [Devosia sp.]
MSEALLHALRAEGAAAGIEGTQAALHAEWQQADVRFVSTNARLTGRYRQAVAELFACIAPTAGHPPILHEGGIYHGCWLESTGTINAELLGRFLPSVTTSTFAAFARHQRADGLFPYKITPQGPGFGQIQLVTPLARSVWNHYRLADPGKDWLATLYDAMARNDAWLARHRDTRGTGAVEAFCAYDTGHDLSSRFWHVPDSPFENDPARCDPDNPLVPFIAPDLTANVACQRRYLGHIARELGRDDDWGVLARQSEEALFGQCYDPDDSFFYDRDKQDRPVRIQSDVLLRVLAAEIGDADLFSEALDRYLLNTRKFFAKYPLTSIALDDPRFDPTFGQNSWNGPTNFLTLIRAAHAFEHHGHVVELTWIMQPALWALAQADRFPQTLNPHNGAAGFTEKYSPSILCMLDFIERLSGILPRPEGLLWFSGLVPKTIAHRQEPVETAYARTIDGTRFELVNAGPQSRIYKDSALLHTFPAGCRLITDRKGTILGMVGLSANAVRGHIESGGQTLPIEVEPNEVKMLESGAWHVAARPVLVLPNHG